MSKGYKSFAGTAPLGIGRFVVLISKHFSFFFKILKMPPILEGLEVQWTKICSKPQLILYTFNLGAKSLWDRGLLSGAGQKAECMSVFHVGETMLSLQKASLIPGGKIVLRIFFILIICFLFRIYLSFFFNQKL